MCTSRAYRDVTCRGKNAVRFALFDFIYCVAAVGKSSDVYLAMKRSCSLLPHLWKTACQHELCINEYK